MPALHALILTAVLAVGAPAATAASCTPPSGSGRAARMSNSDSHSGTDPQVSFSADCDANDHAVNVKPNTAEARRAAEHSCQVTGAAIDAAPWPDGWYPVSPGGLTGGDR